MTRDRQAEYAAIVDEMRRLARTGLEPSKELQDLAAADRAAKQQAVLDAFAEEAHVDLRSIMERARQPDAERSRRIADELARLEAEASRLANQERERFQRIRGHYRDAFQGQLVGLPRIKQLKFREVLNSQGAAVPGECPTHLGSGIFSPWIGPDSVATAEIASDAGGTWLYPRIAIRSNSCDDTRPGTTLQDLTYQLDAPAKSFGFDNVRVDLVANGISSAHLGDTGWFSKPDPLYIHTRMQLDVWLGQDVGGEWHIWPLVSDTLFTAHGTEVSQVRLLLSGGTYSTNLFVRGADVGGGDPLCFVQLACSAVAIGSHATVRLDFGAGDGHGIFVGGVALIGASL